MATLLTDEVRFYDFRVGNSLPPLPANRFLITRSDGSVKCYTYDREDAATLVERQVIRSLSNDGFTLLSDVDLDGDLDLLAVSGSGPHGDSCSTASATTSISHFRIFWNQHRSSDGDTGAPFDYGDPLRPFIQEDFSDVLNSESLTCFHGIAQGDINRDGKEDFVYYGATSMGFFLNTHPDRDATVAPTRDGSALSPFPSSVVCF